VYRDVWNSPLQGPTGKRGTLQSEDNGMGVKNLSDLIRTLTPREQEAGRDFVAFLTEKARPPAAPFLTAVDEFIEDHSELLRRLAR
jgi:hypothetical protein